MQVFRSVPCRLFCITIAMMFLLQGCKPDEAQQGAREPLVKVQTVNTTQVPYYAELPGRARAYHLSEVRPQVTGIILKRLFDEGTNVEKGQQLYQIDPAVYEANYNTAVANQQKAEASLESAKLLYDRYERVAKASGVSRQDLDDAKSAFHQAQAQLASATAAVQSAQIDLGYTKVFAPVSGRIGISSVTEGALVTASQATALTHVQQMDPMNIDIVQSSTEYLRLQRGILAGMVKPGAMGDIPVTLILEDGRPYKHEAHLMVYDVSVDQSTGSITMRAEVKNPDTLILPGMFVRTVVNQGLLTNAILVPQQAVLYNNKSIPYALVVTKENMIETRILNDIIGQYEESWVITEGLFGDGGKPITAEEAVEYTRTNKTLYGLQSGDRVVMEGTMNPAVKSGAKVVAQEYVMPVDYAGPLDAHLDANAKAEQEKSDSDGGKLKAGTEEK